jgi:hypothetical protein
MTAPALFGPPGVDGQDLGFSQRQKRVVLRDLVTPPWDRPRISRSAGKGHHALVEVDNGCKPRAGHAFGQGYRDGLSRCSRFLEKQEHGVATWPERAEHGLNGLRREE